MHVSEVTWRNRNDYAAIMECRHCGDRQQRGGLYADAYFAERVIPSWHCSQCGKNEAGELRAEPVTSE